MAGRPLIQPLSPSRFLRDGLDWTGRTGGPAFAALLLVLGGLWALWRLGPLRFEGWTRWHEAMAALPLVVFAVPAMGHVLRRLNDMGWRGWWAWGLALPWARWALLAVLVAMPSSQRRRRTDSQWRLLGMGVAGMLALVLAGSLVWTAAPVRTQAMKPALLPGDLVLVRRGPLAVARGDVVAFRVGEETAPRFGRVIALGGERVAVEGGLPVIGGVAATRADAGFLSETFGRQGPEGVMPICGNGAVGLGAACLTRRLREVLPDGTAYDVLDAGARPLDRAEEVAVPEGFLYVLGDHRDAGGDSRLAVTVGGTGFVAVERVIGRVDMVLASSEARWPWDPRGWRPGRLGEVVR
ncbi:signal peptidase I [Rubellimicrobium roseum]|uniref:Signal peptidase I n=1 Tax=Rubellimicrobium roseum TaxID=687525 RepID=A0A5C4NB12_9RHOB|nr:signal peptidase I [Rubellimicrobium roseum]TNC70321.1 signal peptidase I [Rubellimicrobium roseum]